MGLLTNNLEREIPLLYSTEEVPTQDKLIVCKFFALGSQYTWYVTEGERLNGDYLFFGLVVGGHEKEWGYFSLKELELIKWMGIPGVERDLHFKPVKVSECKELNPNPITGQNKEENSLQQFASILDKFEAVKVENVDRISPEDVEFCKYYESVFHKAVSVYSEFITTIKSLVTEGERNPYKDEAYNLFLTFSSDVSPSEERIRVLKNNFVRKICYYLASKYKVTIDRSFMDKYDETISYNNILDEVFNQLGGHSFEEKAVNEIKNKMINAASNHRGNPEIKIKNNKLIFDCLHMVRYDDIWKRYKLGSYDDNSRHFYTALCHFDHNRKTYNGEFGQFIDANDKDKPDLFQKYEFFTMNKLRSIKFYKNGKIDVEFTTAEQARDFAKDYCGYIERKEAISA